MPSLPFTERSLGLNLPWLYGKGVSFISGQYDHQEMFRQLFYVKSMGVRLIRTWITVDSLYEYSGGTNGAFNPHNESIGNAHDFFSLAEQVGLDVIVVMADGNSQSQPQSLEGKVQWSLFKTREGIEKYKSIYLDYVSRFKHYKCIYAWETMNEPYGSGTNHGFSAWANFVGVEIEDAHDWLLTIYNAVKGVDSSRIVCFSDYEEDQQEKYRIYIRDDFRKTFIDDCTDVYSLHIYRPGSDYLADYSEIKDKPKWLVEVGHINYYDPEAENHITPGNGELYSFRNMAAVIDISSTLKDQGFSLFMPWSSADNNFITDFSGNKFRLGNLGQWILNTLEKRKYRKNNYPRIPDNTLIRPQVWDKTGDKQVNVWTNASEKQPGVWTDSDGKRPAYWQESFGK